ncbi:hypothetical protein DP116_02925 [Brasilonema bromeliae SPC951]|uniref:Uncharacterized protein n=1 Tax=Brasilonema bromeliae SPC951 TaxID=385972 RepID=A0ABX1P4A0_9CYAN|nr:hypothetical protein [Brasilonema bromeliae SPC951]
MLYNIVEGKPVVVESVAFLSKKVLLNELDNSQSQKFTQIFRLIQTIIALPSKLERRLPEAQLA